MKLTKTSDGETPVPRGDARRGMVNRLAAQSKWLILTLIFFTALGVRFLNWYGSGSEALAVQTSVARNYKHSAELIRTNGLASLYDSSSTTNDPDLLGHPPGYPILLSFNYCIAPESYTATQLLQIIFDSVSVVMIVLIAFEILPIPVGLFAGFLAAFSPQFSWNSLTLLPDSLASLPILLAMFLLVRIRNRKGFDRSLFLSLLGAGALFGLSCWLRANALLLAPFLILMFPFIRKGGERLRPALVLIAGAFLVVAPLTLRNAIVFHKLIPVSLGAGQTLIEGLADYNTDGSFGLPQTDVELIRGEAETFQRPDYAKSLFAPDGIERDRARLSRGLAVIRQHPFWFISVMLRRAMSMLRLERTPLRLPPTALGPALALIAWPLRIVQKLFITAIFLPLALLGAAILAYRRQYQTLVLILIVPFYYFCVQSALHTEYRYVLVIHYFLFLLAALAMYSVARWLWVRSSKGHA